MFFFTGVKLNIVVMKSNTKRTFMKAACLISLTFQNAAYVQIYKYSRIGLPENLYIASTAVCIAEAIKVVLSFFLMITFEKSLPDVCNFFYESVVTKPSDTLHMCIPAIAYVIMTNLSLVSGANLDVITFQIINQLKIPVTVFFSILFLRSKFRVLQYFSVLILMTGAILVQSTDIEDTVPKEIHYENFVSKKLLLSDKTLGIVTGLLACVLSGFSGVYFEKILKSHETTVWSRNLQLSILSIPPALIASFAKDWWQIREKGFFHGYNYVVWIVIFLQAFGGLIVALSVKLTDNVSKSYATSCSIIVAGVSSTIIFHYTFNYQFLGGAALVILSVPLYTIYTITFNEVKVEPVKLETEGRECYI